MAYQSRRNRDRRKYDDKRTIVPVIRNVNTAGKVIHPGEPIPKNITNEKFRKRLWTSGRAVYKEDYRPVKSTPSEETEEQKAEREEARKIELVGLIKALGGKADKRSKLENLESKHDKLVADKAEADRIEAERMAAAGGGDGSDIDPDLEGSKITPIDQMGGAGGNSSEEE